MVISNPWEKPLLYTDKANIISKETKNECIHLRTNLMNFELSTSTFLLLIYNEILSSPGQESTSMWDTLDLVKHCPFCILNFSTMKFSFSF